MSKINLMKPGPKDQQNNKTFLYLQNVISPLQCEEIINQNFIEYIDTQKNKISKFNDILDIRLRPTIDNLVEQVENHYDVEISYISPTTVNYFPEGYDSKYYICDNSAFSNGEWIRVLDNDFSIVIFLKDFNDNPPFDINYEVYGGQLLFPSQNKIFKSIRGDTLIHPSAPQYLYKIEPVLHGDLYFLKINLTCDAPYLYNPPTKKHRGNPNERHSR